MCSANALSEGARQQENGRERTHPLDTEESLPLYHTHCKKNHILSCFKVKLCKQVNMNLKCILLMHVSDVTVNNYLSSIVCLSILNENVVTLPSETTFIFC